MLTNRVWEVLWNYVLYKLIKPIKKSNWISFILKVEVAGIFGCLYAGDATQNSCFQKGSTLKRLIVVFCACNTVKLSA